MIDNYPEFHYTIDGENVYEMIKPKEDGTGLIRSFRIPQGSQPLYFIFDHRDGAEYLSSKGKVIGNEIHLTAADAREFVIVMTRKRQAE